MASTTNNINNCFTDNSDDIFLIWRGDIIENNFSLLLSFPPSLSSSLLTFCGSEAGWFSTISLLR